MSLFDSVQKNKRAVRFLLILIALSFVLIGGEQYWGFFDPAADVAKFSDASSFFRKTEISSRELDDTVQEEQNKLRNYLGAQYDETFFNTIAFRREILQELVDRYLMVQQTNDLNVMVSDRYIVQYIEKIPAFQENGYFSKKKLDSLLAQAGYTRAQLVNDVKRELFTRFVETTIRESTIASSRVVKQLYDYLEQKREVDAFVFKTVQFLPKVSVTEDEVKKYYESHLEQFETPEQVKVAFIALTPEDIEKRVEISDEEVSDYYQARMGEYMVPEKRVARHILIKTDGRNDETAKKKIEEIYTQVIKQPALFPALAKQYSEDALSPAQGGLLDPYAREDLDPAFADALFALRPKEISPVVKSQFGYHIIMLESVQPAQQLALSDVKDAVRAAALKDKLNQELTRQVDDFRDQVYQSDSLAPAADAFGLAIQQSDWLTKDSKASNPWLENKQLRAQLFSAEVLKDRHNTEVIEVTPNVFVAARVADYKPQTRTPLKEVAPSLASRLKNQKAEALAEAEGRKLIQTLRQDPAHPVQWIAQGQVSRETPQQLPDSGVEAVMTVDASKTPAFTGALTGNGFTVYRIERVIYPPMGAPERTMQLKSFQEQVAAMAAQDMVVAYRTALRAEADVEINEKSLEKQN